jgi:hypothetical protein
MGAGGVAVGILTLLLLKEPVRDGYKKYEQWRAS